MPRLTASYFCLFLQFGLNREVIMNARHIVIASCLISCLGVQAVADTPGAANRLTIRFDGLHEVLSGGEDPLKIGIGAEGSLRRGTLTYLTGALQGPGAEEEKGARKRKARDILGADRITIEVEFPPKGAKEKPVCVKGYLGPDRCCGKSLEGFVRVPEEARTGDVK